LWKDRFQVPPWLFVRRTKRSRSRGSNR
jgi:hypothetical protein